ncbi:helix-turn-helix transcriptional regulator [Streptomyces sp. NPDC006733]|uniref:helix-turn-helix domain-containing protein n=1 Tax=Streptomyces sp. NPDC006733 TaxID=3155460 RepID=UPI0033E2DB47
MREQSADLWSRPRLMAAVISRDWGAVLRTYRQLTGISPTRLGELVGLAQPDVSEIERGRRQGTSSEVSQHISAGLGVPPHGRHLIDALRAHD